MPKEQHVVKCLCPSCGQAADVAMPFHGLVSAWGGLATTLTGYRLGLKPATPGGKGLYPSHQNLPSFTRITGLRCITLM